MTITESRLPESGAIQKEKLSENFNEQGINLSDMAAAGLSYVAREDLEKFTGGLLSPRYAANLDAANKGIGGRIRVGRKIAYPAKEVVKFLEQRAQFVDGREEEGSDERHLIS